MRKQVLIQDLPADEMNYDARSVVGARGFAFVGSDGIRVRSLGVQHDRFEYLAEHFWINGHFLGERGVFGHREIEGFKELVKNELHRSVADFEWRVRLAGFGRLTKFVIIKKAPVQEGDSREPVSSRAGGTAEGPEEFVEEAGVIGEGVGLVEIILKTRRKVAPVLIEPATVLKEVKEDQTLKEQLGLRVGLGGRKLVLVLFEVRLDGLQRVVEPLEEVPRERLLVESLGPGRKPACGGRKDWQAT